MIHRYILLLIGALLITLGSSLGVAQEITCPEKSLFINISSERVRAVQVGLLVAFANAAPPEMEGVNGQGAAVQLFFADAAAPYVIDSDKLSHSQRHRLDGYLRKTFGYGISDVERLQSQNLMVDGLPGIFAMRDMFGAQVFACSLCVSETLHAIHLEVDGLELMDYLIEGAELMTPPGFSVIYDIETEDCSTKAAVISF